MEADKAAGPLGSASSEGLGPLPLWRDDAGRSWWGADELTGEALLAWRDAAVAAERERCVQIALDAPMVEPPLDDDPPEVDTALKSMAVSIAARIRGLEPLPRHGVQTGLDFGPNVRANLTKGAADD